VGGAQGRDGLVDAPLRILGPDRALVDEPLGVELATMSGWV
jgi:hypothetical protein